jgi:TP901-1 family phage major tail protein
MTAQRGRDMLLRVEITPPGTFQTIAGLRARQISINTDTVDITHTESVGRWRELLSGAGARRASISGSGVFRDEASHATARQIVFDGEIRNWQIIVPDFGRIEGRFQISTLEYRGEHTAEVTFEMSLESAGALTFTAI